MANVLNRTTFEYRESVNTPDYSPADWIINPTQQEISDAAIQRQSLIDAQMAADAPYRQKPRDQILAELNMYIDPVPEDIIGTHRILVSGEYVQEQYVIQRADTQQEIEEKLARAERFRIGLREMPFFYLRLDGYNYNDARADARRLVDAGILLSGDYDIVDSVLPLQRT